MRAVVRPEFGVIEVNWSWLPTFIGMNQKLQDQIIAAVTPKIAGLPVDDATLDTAHDLVVDEIVNFPAFACIEGIREYLDGLKFVRYLNDGEQRAAR